MRVGKFIFEFVNGIRNRIPPCCSARFAWDLAHDRFPTAYRISEDFDGVPCGIFHKATGTLKYAMVQGHRVPISGEIVGPDYEPPSYSALDTRMLFEDDQAVAVEFIPVDENGHPIYTP